VSITEGRLSRADLLKAGAAGALGLTFAGPALAKGVRIESTTLNLLTWSDHYANDQLKAVAKAPPNWGLGALLRVPGERELGARAT